LVLATAASTWRGDRRANRQLPRALLRPRVRRRHHSGGSSHRRTRLGAWVRRVRRRLRLDLGRLGQRVALLGAPWTRGRADPRRRLHPDGRVDPLGGVCGRCRRWHRTRVRARVRDVPRGDDMAVVLGLASGSPRPPRVPDGRRALRQRDGRRRGGDPGQRLSPDGAATGGLGVLLRRLDRRDRARRAVGRRHQRGAVTERVARRTPRAVHDPRPGMSSSVSSTGSPRRKRTRRRSPPE